METYLCPVCGYDRLESPPQDWSICPCCLTEFGYSDYKRSHAALRAEWIANGAKWGDPSTPKPPHWNPIKQLRHVGYDVTPAEHMLIEGQAVRNP